MGSRAADHHIGIVEGVDQGSDGFDDVISDDPKPFGGVPPCLHHVVVQCADKNTSCHFVLADRPEHFSSVEPDQAIGIELGSPLKTGYRGSEVEWATVRRVEAAEGADRRSPDLGTLVAEGLNQPGYGILAETLDLTQWVSLDIGVLQTTSELPQQIDHIIGIHANFPSSRPVPPLYGWMLHGNAIARKSRSSCLSVDSFRSARISHLSCLFSQRSPSDRRDRANRGLVPCFRSLGQNRGPRERASARQRACWTAAGHFRQGPGLGNLWIGSGNHPTRDLPT